MGFSFLVAEHDSQTSFEIIITSCIIMSMEKLKLIS